jgi:hypothetical protein
MRSVGPVLALTVLIGPLLRAQGQSLDSRLDPAIVQALTPVLAAARRDSVPIRALEAKALEGAAKRRPTAAIVAAVQRLSDEFRAARAALRRGAPSGSIADGEIVAAADAMRRGVPADDIATLRRNVPPTAVLEIPLAVLGDLVQRGVPVDHARGVMEEVVRTNVPLDRVVEIPVRIDVALRVGAPPIVALSSALQGLGIPIPPTIPGRPRPIPPAA